MTATTKTTPGLARLRKSPRAAATRAAVLADQRKGRKAAAAKLAAGATTVDCSAEGGSCTAPISVACASCRTVFQEEGEEALQALARRGSDIQG